MKKDIQYQARGEDEGTLSDDYGEESDADSGANN